MRRALLVVAIASTGLASRTAGAGCKTVCDVAADSVSVQPPLACAQVRALPSGCDCGFDLQVDSACAGALRVAGLRFDHCWKPDQRDGARADCDQLATGERGATRVALAAVGRSQRTFSLEADDGAHTVVVVTTVTSFREAGGCAVGGRGGAPGGWPGVAALALLGAARRRRQGR